MTSRFIVGVTGGIGCGKSTACALLRELGAAVLDADAVTHALYRANGRAAIALTQALGTGILDAAGAVDRTRLGAAVFADDALRRRVEAIVHPLVMAEVEAWVAALPKELLPVVEVPLLYESGLEGAFSRVVAVLCSPATQRARLRARHPGAAEADLERRLQAQWPIDEKRRRAHHVLENDGELATLRASCAALMDELCRAKAAWEKD